MTDRNLLHVNLETDDRTVLFPAGKYLTHIVVHPRAEDRVQLEAAFTFNEAREPAEIVELSLADTFAFARAILDSVYQGRTQHMLTEEMKIAIVFNANGFLITFGTGGAAKELFITSAPILRLAQALLRVADRMDADPAN
jgi:hypothetical protein